ncbi:MAG: FtsH protease activity modulator HflK [Xanthomonadaceae bacterium]|nr:FtsH protease activity modulator HflK [Xanthomonadaceae bacterium]
MKKRILEMAWKAPNDGQDSGQNRGNNGYRPPNQGGESELDKLLKKVKSSLGGGGSSAGTPKGLGLYVGVGLVVALGFWLSTGIYTVDAGQKGVELFLGKYSKTKDAGLTWRFPSPLGEHRIIDIQRRYSQKIGGSATNGGRSSAMLTKDENIVDVRVEVQYQIDNLEPHKYWFASVNPDATLKEVVDSATRERVGQTLLDDILTDGREKLMQEVKELAQSIINNYGIGLTITNVNLEDAQAPLAVQDAFSDAIRAREDEQSRINQSLAYKSKVEEEARGEAGREIQQAEAYRDSKIAVARGEAERFNQLYTAYKVSPEITRERLYLETIEEVLQGTNKIIMNEGNSNNLMMLPLDKMMKERNDSPKKNSDKDSILTRETLPSQSGSPLMQGSNSTRSGATVTPQAPAKTYEQAAPYNNNTTIRSRTRTGY